MAGGRPTKGGDLVDKFDVDRQSKEKVRWVLEAQRGTVTTAQAAKALGVSVQRFHQIQDQVVRGGLEAVAPKKRGRPVVGKTRADHAEVKKLRKQVETMERDLKAANVLAELAVTMPEVVKKTLEEKLAKKVRRQKRNKRKRGSKKR